MTSTLSPPTLALRWTDYPLMDAALAGLCVFCGVRDPEQLTPEHLQEFQQWAEKSYFTSEMRGWIFSVFTLNGFMNTNREWTDEMRRDKLREVLAAYQRPNTLPERCAIFPKLQAQQRVARDLMPMLMGRGPMNFYPDGQPGLPLSGQAITALQGLSLAAPLVSGRAMILDADDKQLLLDVVSEWQKPWLERITLSNGNDSDSLGWAFARTRLVEAIRKVIRKQPRRRSSEILPFVGSATIYHLTNNGKAPDAAIYTLEQPALRFMERASQEHPEAWKPLFQSKHHAADKSKDGDFGFRNELDEAMFSLPDAAPTFLRRYLLPPFTQALKVAHESSKKAGRANRKKDTKKLDDGPKPIPLSGLWGITELFLEEVVGMEKARVEAIRSLADRLSYWINYEEDLKLFKAIYIANGAGPLRQLLLKASFEQAKDNRVDARPDFARDRVLINEDEYRQIFVEQDEVARADFTLARDLLKMRLLELMVANPKQLLHGKQAETELQDLTPSTEQGDE